MNLFMISAPYQILNALEAIHYLNLTNNNLRIIDTGHFTRGQYNSVIDPSLWASIRFHNFRYRLTNRDFGAHPPTNLKERLLELLLVLDQALKRWRVFGITRCIGPVDNLFLGNYRRHYDSHMRHIANRIRFNRLYVLDVGTDTLQVNSDRHEEKRPAPFAPSNRLSGGFRGMKQWIRQKAVEWDTRGVAGLTFFTSYDLVPAPGDSVIPNRYRYLRSVISGANQSGQILFVGQPLVDQFYLTGDTFCKVMIWVKSHFAGKELIYVPHPRESEKQLQVIRSLGIRVRQFGVPFEYIVFFTGERPDGIVSFFSSVLENSAAIFNGHMLLKAFRLPGILLLKDRENVDRVYAKFAETENIEIVEPDAKDCSWTTGMTV